MGEIQRKDTTGAGMFFLLQYSNICSALSVFLSAKASASFVFEPIKLEISLFSAENMASTVWKCEINLPKVSFPGVHASESHIHKTCLFILFSKRFALLPNKNRCCYSSVQRLSILRNRNINTIRAFFRYLRRYAVTFVSYNENIAF